MTLYMGTGIGKYQVLAYMYNNQCFCTARIKANVNCGHAFVDTVTCHAATKETESPILTQLNTITSLTTQPQSIPNTRVHHLHMHTHVL